MKLLHTCLSFGSRSRQLLALSSLLFFGNTSSAALISIDDLQLGDLLITEVMANPAAVSDTNGEWFEILNTTADDIDLLGLTLSDNGSNSHTLNDTAPIMLNAGQYFTLGRNANTEANGGVTLNYQYSNFTLANSSDELILSAAARIIDSVEYAGPPFAQSGVSAEIVADGFALTLDSNNYGLGDIGTPGAAGSYSPPVDLAEVIDPAPVAVPEPSSLVLLGLGLCGLIMSRRHRDNPNLTLRYC